MLDDFFTRALVAGIGVAIVAGPLGCFVIWRRMAYFGDTLSHSALLGVSLALLLQVNATLAVGAVSMLLAILLVILQRKNTLSSDAILGLLSHSALALGLVCLAFMTWVRVDLLGLLFGDILSVTKLDIAMIFAGGSFVLAVLISIWRKLFAATVSPDLAAGEGLNPDRTELIFMLLTAVVIAISLKIIGALLITALLIIPAAAARRLSATPEQMAVMSALLGAVAVVSGLYASLNYDTPSGPSIVVAAMVLFVISLAPGGRFVRSLLVKRQGDQS
ncbi:MAG: metal ABC transporter permease [Roseibium sp.]|uniref:metal ABC transporter permease n=1 Tax=Roseibium sp. TaxID=1936156 RepID=UPI001B214323|nr:metal ABC transporter permease [Roseibium sp.]MBO6891133.1 metal ABC transporter permease [Roseibium sp.]MBO6930880.1 metal ABC transporter permease [Roseibium sp.]